MKALHEDARLKTQRDWLQRHTTNAEIPSRHAEYFRQQQILKHLLRGADFVEGSPLREVETALHFAASAKSGGDEQQRGRRSKSLHKSKGFTSAIARLEEYDNECRWRRGLNAITLLTEYRRKIIFHAMLDTNDVNEERSVAREKLDSYLCTFAPELLDTPELEAPQQHTGSNTGYGHSPTYGTPMQQTEATSPPRKNVEPIVYSSESTTASDKRRRDTLKRSIEAKNAFAPKLGEYDVMRNRWRYIKPQIQQLRSDGEMLAPTSPERQLQLRNKVVLRGTIHEASDYLRRSAEEKN